MIQMAHVEDIRKLLHVEGKSQRQVANELGISRHTVAKYANQTDVPKYRRLQPYAPTVMTEEFQQQIDRLLTENETLPRKQRWIGHTVFRELQQAGYTGSEPTVRRYVARRRKEQRKRAAYVPLDYEPGEVAEVDWGQAQVVLGGVTVTVQILCFRLRWSHMPFVFAYPNQRQEAMFDGLQRAMAALGGCPAKLTSDNMRQMVQKILEGRNREEQDAYRRFRTYFLVDSNFCNPASGNEKGSVENLVGFAQRNIVGPRMEAISWADLNERLWQNCLIYAQRRLRGEALTVKERWQQEQTTLRSMPSRPFDCARAIPVTSTGTACVQFETNRYSVPVQYVGRALFLKAYWDRVEVYAGADRIAEHPRCYKREQEILDLDHYLDLLERKPGALDQARPFRKATLPAVYHQFRAALNERGRHGEREFIRLLMLNREFPRPAVEAAVTEALRVGTVHVQAVRDCLVSQVRASNPPATYADELEAIRVRQPALQRYDALLKGGVVHLSRDLLVEHYLRRLKLPTIRRLYRDLAREAAEHNKTFEDYLLALLEQEVIQREDNQTLMRLKAAGFPVAKTLDSFDFTSLPNLNKQKVLALSQADFVKERENILLVGNSGTGKTHLATALGVCACRKGYRVRFWRTARLVEELLEAQQEHRLTRLEKQWLRLDVVVLDELGYVSLNREGARLLFQFLSAKYETGSLVVTTNLEFREWAEVFQDEKMAAALVDRLTHRAHLLNMNGDSYRFRESLRRAGT